LADAADPGFGIVERNQSRIPALDGDAGTAAGFHTSEPRSGRGKDAAEGLCTHPSLQDLVGEDILPVQTLLNEGTFQTATSEQRRWLEQLREARAEARTLAAQAISRLENLERRCRQFADGINMRFLYDPVRRLFGIGYAIGNPVQFNGHYDLLTV
jgi:hypothetical protein